MRLVKDYMTKDILSVNETTTLKRVIVVMSRHRMCAVPVVNALGEYIGCINEMDLLSAAMPIYMKSIVNASFLANIDVVSKHLSQKMDLPAIQFTDLKYPKVKPNDSLSYAVDLLFRSKRNMIPVVDGNSLIGQFSRLDFLSISILESESENSKNHH